MANKGSEEREWFPASIRRRLDNPPVLPGESESEFRMLFGEVSYSADGGEKTFADHTMDYEATVLIWNLQRIDRMIVALIRQMHPTAVAALVRRSSPYGGSGARLDCISRSTR